MTTSCCSNGSDSPHRRGVMPLLRAIGCVRTPAVAFTVQGVSGICPLNYPLPVGASEPPSNTSVRGFLGPTYRILIGSAGVATCGDHTKWHAYRPRHAVYAVDRWGPSHSHIGNTHKNWWGSDVQFRRRYDCGQTNTHTHTHAHRHAHHSRPTALPVNSSRP